MEKIVITHENIDTGRSASGWPATGRCKNKGLPLPAVLRSSESPSQCVLVHLWCKCWTCRPCRARTAKLWHERAASRLAADLSAGRIAFTISVTEAEWLTTHKAICRSGASYVRIDNANGGFTVIGTVDPDGRIPRKATAVSAHHAFALLVKFLMWAANHEFRPGVVNRPVSTSRCWGELEDDGVEYEFVGWVAGDWR